MAKTGGEILVECLKAQQVERAFCVPGESYLAVLDALYDAGIDLICARQEGGAALMAEADGKMTGRPGVAFVTRGPGATNAAAGVHVAKQDSTPMILFVGQIGREMKGREAFQEVDYRQTFGDLAKWVEEIDQTDRIPEVLSHAWHVAMSGRPGPVVLALPEDMLRDLTEAAPSPFVRVAEPAPSPQEIAALGEMLGEAERPMMILGGSRWDADAVAAAQDFAERRDIPVAASFRRQGLFDHLHPNYAGDVAIGANPDLLKRIKESDLLIVVGARLSEIPSQGFSLIDFPTPQMKMVHVHPGPEELGRLYAPTLPINAVPGGFFAAAEAIPPQNSAGRAEAAHASYLAWTDTPPETPGAAKMGPIVAHLRDAAPEAIITNGAGNYTTWAQRFWRFRRFGQQLAPTSGSMGVGLPAALAAKARHPDQEVICFAGDGCFQMTSQEFGTAAQYGLNVIVMLVDNGSWGTIRMHQEQRYPGRVVATDLVNPDFAALARAYGGHGETVEQTEEFGPALARARAAEKPAIIHIKTDTDAITPGKTLSEMRAAAQSAG